MYDFCAVLVCITEFINFIVGLRRVDADSGDLPMMTQSWGKFRVMSVRDEANVCCRSVILLGFLIWVSDASDSAFYC